MKLLELKDKIQQYQYFNDTNIIDVALASIVANRLSIGDPIWLIIIGASSGGKSQILRPLALTDEKYLHRIDDVTENTFLSGAKAGDGKKMSLLDRIGSRGIIVISDLTVLFSKAKEARATILSQFRMIYDGEMTKFSGNSDKPITWKGALGVLAGSTPSIYTHFEEVADMGERFIYYRMKEYDAEKATRLSMGRTLFGKNLDNTLKDIYDEYIKDVVKDNQTYVPTLADDITDTIINIAMLAEKIRTTSHLDWKDRVMDRIPVSAMPMRVALQLSAIAKGLMIMRHHEGQDALSDTDKDIIEWCGYSLANEEKRACLRIIARADLDVYVRTSTVSDEIGLANTVVSSTLQNLASVGVLKRTGGSDGYMWKIANESYWKTIRRIEGLEEKHTFKEREVSSEEKEDKNVAMDKAMEELAGGATGLW